LPNGRVLIDCKKDELFFRINQESVKFNVLRSLKHPHEDVDSCCFIDHLQDLIQDEFEKDKFACPMDACLALSTTVDCDDIKLREAAFHLEATEFVRPPWKKYFEIELSGQKLKPSILEPPTNLVLKELPPYMKYVFLQGEQLPLIISSSLSSLQEKKLMRVLR
ncbi:UNVERIFIED_CONTAM: hypothetical protein ITH36_24620, partial [Salmonella enterica subsp. enterica serovar Weltevreden]